MRLDTSKTVCSICHQPCFLEICVIDEHGRAVHEPCYASAVMKIKRTKYEETEDLLERARQLREMADRLIARSDELVAANRKLTGQARSGVDDSLHQDQRTFS